jgi:hypothetical protein
MATFSESLRHWAKSSAALVGLRPASGRKQTGSVVSQDRRRNSCRLSLEQLEERAVPSILFRTSASTSWSNNGGATITYPSVELVFWGNPWNQNTAFLNQIQNAVDAILQSHYLDGLQAFASNFGNGHRRESTIITGAGPGGTFTQGNVQTMLANEIDSGNLPEPDEDAQLFYYVIAPPGYFYVSNPPATAFHAYFTWNDYDLGDIDNSNAHYGASGDNGTIDFITTNFSHELAEACSDAEGSAIQVNPRGATNWNEIADGPAQAFTYRLNGVPNGQLVQAYLVPPAPSSSVTDYIVTTGQTQDFLVTSGALTVQGDQLGTNYNDVIDINLTSNGGVDVSLNGEDVQFDPGVISSITVNTGGGTNDVSVWATTGSAPVTINDGGNDNVSIGLIGSAQLINGTVSVNNAPGRQAGTSTTLNVDDSAHSGNSNVVTLTNGSISGLAPVAINFDQTGLGSLLIQTTSPTVNVQSTPNNTSLPAGRLQTTLGTYAASTVTVGNGSSVTGIQGDLSLTNISGGMTLTVDDSADGGTPTATISAFSVTGLSAGTIGYDQSSLTAFNVDLGPSTSYIVQSTPNHGGMGTVKTTISGGIAGGSPLPPASAPPSGTVGNGGSLSGIQGTLVFASSVLPLTVDDSADSQTALTNITLDSFFSGSGLMGSITNLAPAEIDFDYSSTPSVTLKLGANSQNVVKVNDVGVTTNVVGSAPLAVHVGGDFSDLSFFTGTLNLTNPASFDTITVDDSKDATAPIVTLATFTGSDGSPWGSISGFEFGGVIDYRYGDTVSPVTLDAASGSMVYVQSVGKDVNVVGNGLNTIDVGDGSLAGIQANVNLSNPSGQNTVTIDDSSDPTPAALTLGSFTQTDGSLWGQVTGLGFGRSINYSYAETASPLTVDTAAASTLNVQGIGDNLNVVGNGPNTVTVGNGTFNGIQANIDVTNPPDYTTLIIDDSKDVAHNFTIGSAAVTDFTDKVQVDYLQSDLASLTLKGGSGGNTFTVAGTPANVKTPVTTIAVGSGTNTVMVQATSAGSSLVLNGGGADTFDVGSTTSLLNNVQGSVTVAGTSTSETLNYNDLGAAPALVNYLISNTTLTRTGTATITYSGITAVAIEAANAGSTGGNYLNIYSTALGAKYDVYAGSGINEFIVAGLPYTLDGIHGALAMHGSGNGYPNNNLVELVDFGSTSGHSYQLTAGKTPESGAEQRFSLTTGQRDMAPITYDGINSYTVVSTATNSAINVLSVNMFLDVETTNGDTVTIGSRAPGLGGTLAGITGELLILSASLTAQKPQIILDDSGNTSTAARTITLGSDPFYGYLVNGLANASQGNGLIGFRGIDPASPVSILTGSTSDTFQVKDFVGAPALSIKAGRVSSRDTLIGPNQTNTWTVTGAGSGSLDSTLAYSGIVNLVGGTGVDTFQLKSGGSVIGTINGGGAPAGQGDWLDYSALSTAVTVNLATGTATSVDGRAAGGVTNIQNVFGSNGGCTLIGNAQGNILIGGAGTNSLIGGSGRSLLIADRGVSTIKGGSGGLAGGGDILIGGYTSYDAMTAANETALMSILAEWQSADSFATRFTDIDLGAGGGLNGTNKLNWGTTVFDNNMANTVTAQAGTTALDWFFANTTKGHTTVHNFRAGDHMNNT